MSVVALVDQRVCLMRNELSRVRSHLDTWLSNQRRTVDHTLEMHKRHMSISKEQLESLMVEHEQLSQQAAALRAQIEGEQKVQNEIGESVRRAEKGWQDVQSQVMLAEKENERELAVVRTEADRIDGLEREVEYKTENLRSGLKFYEEFMGIRLGSEQVPDVGTVATIYLSKIDPRNPKSQATFTIIFANSGEYRLHDSSPRLSNAAELVQTFGKQRDFGAFVRAVRKEFRKLY
eukprot:ANDGO_03972.mRNA.1 kinetochore protein Spc25